ncbi:MAG: 4Fe-4S binding protein [Caldilineaceae bacterium]|nr:4Fe-4S binding protein [Caldilineaceae bacterium]HRJ45692.1 4Fe-4S binding protein [Caldilineaceae bacterium]
MAHGTVVIDRDRCKGCALCTDVCPKNLLHLESGYNARGYHPVMLADGPGHCTGCAICAVICPDVVFTVYREGRRL